MIITIDGPVASGKSSVARALSQHLDIYYLYTGLLYRSVAHVLATTDETLDDLSFISCISYSYQDDKPQLLYGEQDITKHLAHESLSQQASIVSANPHVRTALLPLQHQVGKTFDLVADGRDCGSVVFPHAPYKFYLTASIDVRAQRLLSDTKRGGVVQTLYGAIEEITARDKRDMEREVAPLRVPEGGVTIDNSDMSIEKTVQQMLAHITCS